MNKEALIRVADMLENERNADGTYTIGGKTFKFDFVAIVEHGCACAFGLAGQHPWFNSQGFFTSRGEDLLIRYTNTADASEYYGLEAVDRFFDLSFNEGHHLFFSGPIDADGLYCYDDPILVAKRIRKFVEDSAVC